MPHGYELPFVFNYDNTANEVPLTQPRDVILKEHMGKLWTNFILTGYSFF